jgi:formylglycine-generating enzyme required for sulfatase activity
LETRDAAAAVGAGTNGVSENTLPPRVKILDFGLARTLSDDAQLTADGAIIGTPQYMAPEQARGQPLDHRCDLFSLGGVMFQMATGRCAFQGRDPIQILMAVANAQPPTLRELYPELPVALSDLVKSLLEQDPQHRPESARKVAQSLAALERGSFPSSKVETCLPPTLDYTPRISRGKRRWLLLGLAGTLGLFVLLYLVLSQPFQAPSETGGQSASTEATSLRPADTVGAVPEPIDASIPSTEPPPLPQPSPTTAAPGKPYINSLGMKLAPIAAGKFRMGSRPEEIQRCLNLKLSLLDEGYIRSEGPGHEVVITEPFYMGVHEVTFGQFMAFARGRSKYKNNDGWRKAPWAQTGEHPVVHVSWDDAVQFCNWLSQREGKTYRLPTEAEWEYCCRAGGQTRYCFGDQDNDLPQFAWTEVNSQNKAHPVGQLKSNAWGLHDMHGNVWEWCQDLYDARYYHTPVLHDPPGGSTGSGRVIRGGSWQRGEPISFRSAFRQSSDQGRRSFDVGFRVVMTPKGSPASD